MSKQQAELKLDRLMANRENTFRRAQLCFEAGRALKLDRNDAKKLENFKIRYGTFPKVTLDYREIIQQIVIVKQELKPDELPNFEILNAFEDLCDNVEYMAVELLSSNVPTTSSNNNSNNPNIQQRIHIPKI